jgi:4-amino-4-deoxy-L-arabinose transferase-like glycosyltransferase
VAREVSVPPRERDSQTILVLLAALVALRGVVAATAPLSFDEAYYWQWSKNLAWGYYDHPPMVAFIIRAGTALFGDTIFGIRFIPWLLSIGATFAVWRAGAILFESGYAGALSALLFNAMPMVGVEMVVATPDAPQIAAAAVLICVLAKLIQTGNGAWWIAAGVVSGLGLLSKYTTLFLGVGMLFWLLVARPQRRWLMTVWPYLGGVVALVLFLPVIMWNASHDWMSFRLQFGRIGSGGFTLRYLGEFLAAQLGLASPVIAVLGVAGLVSMIRSPDAPNSKRTIIAALMVPAMAYFVWHSLRGRVQGNWPSFLYPAFALAAVAAMIAPGRQRWRAMMWSREAALPVALVMTAIIYAQAVWGIVPLREPVSRLLAAGMGPVAEEIDRIRSENSAGAIVTTSYELQGWLSFYMPSRAPVIQVNERFRWLNAPEPPRQLFDGPMLYVTQIRNDQAEALAMRFGEVTKLGEITRTRNGAALDQYRVYRVGQLKGQPFY